MSHVNNPHTPHQALAELKAGNQRFKSGQMKHPNQDSSRREQLVKEGQTPMAAILACSDSRVPVELIFDQGFGDVFIVRVPGSIPGPTQLGGLEYAVDHLGVPLIVVLAHTKCGAMTAALANVKPGGPLGEVLSWLDPVVAEVESLPQDDRMDAALVASTKYAIKCFKEACPKAAQAESEGRLAIVGAVYHLETDDVIFL